jgi:hypothetical protein
MGEKKNVPATVTTDEIEALIFPVGRHRVILDADLARLYAVTTKALNQAVKRNRDRFPEDFAFRLVVRQSGAQSVASQVLDEPGFNGNRSQAVTGSAKHRDKRFPPLVFTEHGVLMAANVLRSGPAARMSIFVIRAFVRLREQVSANAAILKRLAEIDSTLLQQDAALRDIYRKLLPLLQPPPEPRRRGIGFHTGKM